MFERILVPLDGSPLAERAVPVAARIARATNGTVVLLRVTSSPVQYGPYLYGSYVSQSPLLAQEILDAEQLKAQYYLAALARLENLLDIKVETHVNCGAAAPTILENGVLGA